MSNKKKTSNKCCKGSKLFVISAVVLTSLLVLDIIFQGQVYKRLPTTWQNVLSEWIGR